jgi:hypothetical protein
VVAHEEEAAAGKVRMTFRVVLPRPVAEALVARAIREEKERRHAGDGDPGGGCEEGRSMNRRAFLTTLGGGHLAAPLDAEAQPAGKVYRVGYMSPVPGHNPIDELFERSLKELHHVDQLAPAAGELVRLNVALIVAWSPAATALLTVRRNR